MKKTATAREIDPKTLVQLDLSRLPWTPALVIDEQVATRNVKKLAAYAQRSGLRIRPHTKTHKSIELATRQISAGAIGLTAAKVGEVEAMVHASDDILMAYPAVDPARCGRLGVLAKSATIRVAIDSHTAREALGAAARLAGSTIGILVDQDVGMHRTGLQSSHKALELAQAVARTPSLRLDGLFCYPGHIWAPAAEQGKALGAVADLLQETLDLWSQAGLAAAIVSGGSTPTAYQSHRIPQLTEIRPGTYIFNDMNTVAGGFCTLEDCAASVVCTVVSNAVPGKVVIDAGTKTLTSDRCIPNPESGHGYIVQYPAAKIIRLSEEHGEVDVTGCDRVPAVGERIQVIPNHICPCVNLQDSLFCNTVEGAVRSIKVDARGKLS